MSMCSGARSGLTFYCLADLETKRVEKRENLPYNIKKTFCRILPRKLNYTPLEQEEDLHS